MLARHSTVAWTGVSRTGKPRLSCITSFSPQPRCLPRQRVSSVVSTWGEKRQAKSAFEDLGPFNSEPLIHLRLSLLFYRMNREEAKALATKRPQKGQLRDKSLYEVIVLQAFKCLCSLSSFFPEESWVSADRRGEPWKMLGSSQSNSIRGRNGLLKHEEGKSFAAYQQLGPNDIIHQNQRKWANQICIKALFVCLLRKLQFAFKLEVEKKNLFEKFWPWYFASLNCFQLLEQTWK